MDKKRLHKELHKFGKYVIQQSRSRLTRNGHNKSKDLYSSLSYKSKAHKNSFSLSFYMMDYGEYQDRGVHGAKSSYIEVKDSPFSYKSGGKKPPASVFETWGKEHNVSPFAVANSVWSKGLKPTMFFTTPFERAFERLPDDIIEKFGLDIEEFAEQTLTN